jgi:hypothetical protein
VTDFESALPQHGSRRQVSAAEAPRGPVGLVGITQPVAVGFRKQQQGPLGAHPDQITAVSAQIAAVEAKGPGDQIGPFQQGEQASLGVVRRLQKGPRCGAIALGQPTHQPGEGSDGGTAGALWRCRARPQQLGLQGGWIGDIGEGQACSGWFGAD